MHTSGTKSGTRFVPDLVPQSPLYKKEIEFRNQASSNTDTTSRSTIGWEGEFKSTTCTFKSSTGELACHDFENGNFKSIANSRFFFFMTSD